MAAQPPRPRAASSAGAPPGWLRETAVIIFGVLVIVYMLVPIVVIVVFSFNDPAGKFNFTWSGFTLDALGRLLEIPELTDALLPSLDWRCSQRDLDRPRHDDRAGPGSVRLLRPPRGRTS